MAYVHSKFTLYVKNPFSSLPFTKLLSSRLHAYPMLASGNILKWAKLYPIAQK